MNYKNIANIILGGILIYSGGNICTKLIDYSKSSSLYSEIKEIANSETSDDNEEVNEYLKQINTYNKLKEINNEYVFWINVENTNIDYPVVQTTDNQFYLKKDFNKNKSSAGTIFMDTLNNFMTDKNIVLYGHNMRNKTMFNNITKFKDKNFFEQNNKITIKNTSNGKEYIYEVFSVYHTDNNFNYNTVVFNENYTYEQYLEDIKKKSTYKKKIDVTATDRIITLSTCSYEFKGAKTSIHAKLVEVRDLNPNSITNKYNKSDKTNEDEINDSFSVEQMFEY